MRGVNAATLAVAGAGLCWSMAGCALRPVAQMRGSLYLGAFTRAAQNYEAGVRYEQVRGVGVALGVRRAGIGYFDDGLLVIPDPNVAQTIPTRLGIVVVGEPKAQTIPLPLTP